LTIYEKTYIMNPYILIFKQICLPRYKNRVCFQKVTRPQPQTLKKEDDSWLFVGYILQIYCQTKYKPNDLRR
jgi:hypothetical protein